MFEAVCIIAVFPLVVWYAFYMWLIKTRQYTLHETWPVALAAVTASIILAWLCLKLYDYPDKKMVEKPIKTKVTIYIIRWTLLFLFFLFLVSSHQPLLLTLKVFQEVNLYRGEVIHGTHLEFVVF